MYKLDIQSVTVIAFVAGVIGYLYYSGRKRVAKRLILGLVTKAERLYGSGKGEIKYQFVVDRVYPRLPAIVRTFMTKEIMDDYIEEAVEEIKDALEEDKEES